MPYTYANILKEQDYQSTQLADILCDAIDTKGVALYALWVSKMLLTILSHAEIQPEGQKTSWFSAWAKCYKTGKWKY